MHHPRRSMPINIPFYSILTCYSIYNFLVCKSYKIVYDSIYLYIELIIPKSTVLDCTSSIISTEVIHAEIRSAVEAIRQEDQAALDPWDDLFWVEKWTRYTEYTTRKWNFE